MTQREQFEKALREMKIDAFHSLELNNDGDGYKNISTTILFAGFRIGLKAAKAQAVPEGYRLMPPEPTLEMIKTWRESPFSDDHEENLASGYDAMFFAAPAQEQNK